MLLTEFFNNPMGKGATALNIKSTKESFDKKYNNYYKDISHKAFFIKDNIYVLIKIPSSVRGIFYDVVIKFTPTNKSAGVSVCDMDYQFFSNSPSFLYTYANAYNKNKLLIKELNKKLSKEMVKELASTRNPYRIISYDITIYSALKYLLTTGFDKIESLKMNSVTSSTTSKLLNEVQDWDTLQKKRAIQKTANKLEEEEEKQEKIKYSSKIISESEDSKDDEVPKTSKVKTVKAANKKVAKTKKTKKTKK